MYCTNCGRELAPEAKFCSNCGAAVTSGASAEPAIETPAERRERERREDFARAWGTSNESAGRDPSVSPQDDESSDEASRSDDLVDRDPSVLPQNDVDSTGAFATRSATWEVERAKLRSGDLDDEWSMSDLGPAKPQRRRIWLWVVLGLVVIAVIACCVFGWWLLGTESGKEFMNNIEVQLTQTAEAVQRATQPPATPQP
ncbi:MAG: zinc-ribbon domain-containing protein [Thermomicrobiales bacterium]|nr:zinc-ribbon domain-containing protein [Thermomicrobiales bacterium]MCO5217863.1 zinc-ribbon domain-containing protein [Thermomicrobiales bacterium]MCO5223884.1 zinc-ribbon domain-containing protein [Thermomicrobiales bacterium]MCO5227448.1 zinc-ribbon domain-containing protein [Thermomicrobiales bacterium]